MASSRPPTSLEDQIFDDPSYQRLSDIQIDLSSSHGYEDPTPLLQNVPQRPSQRRAPVKPPRGSKPRRLADEDIEEALLALNGHGEGAVQPPHSTSQSSQGVPVIGGEGGSGEVGSGEVELIEEWNSEGSSEDESPVTSKGTVVRQMFPAGGVVNGRGTPTAKGVEDKLYVSGTLVDHRAPLSFKSRLQRTDSSEVLQEQGIYQGLVMTDSEKRRLGILPESIYMTTNLEQWASQLEDMALKYPPRLLSTASTSSLPQRSPPPIPSASRRQRPKLSVPAGPITPKYRDSVLRPPPLPPLASGATREQRKAYAVVESLLKSEAAFLTSLNIAIQSYMRPLLELSGSPSPILDKDQVEILFGPITKVISHHELFYTALTSRTMQWGPMQRVGDVFMSSFSRKEVIHSYSEYVNNFTDAMVVLERAIKKKAKFVNFLKEKYKSSKTSLSLQGLLLKPIQRFPQYILFLQDLLKYTSTTHPDHLHLQMSLSRFEATADYLNEMKRRKEQCCIVQYLNTRVSGLPFKLVDSKRWLYRQDVVTALLFTKSKEVVQKQRILLLFNNMVLCASVKHKPKAGDLESSTGSKDFKTNQGATYACKWYAPLDSVEIVEPDYHSDIWDHILCGDDYEEQMTAYHRLKAEYKKLEQDFATMGKIAGLVATLHEQQEVLTLQSLQTYTRVLQRRLARNKEQIQQCQVGRVDLVTPSWNGNRKVHRTYLFMSEKAKQEWLNMLRYAGLKLNRFNANAWVCAEDLDDGDVIESIHRPPLYVDSFRLMVNDIVSVECAVKVGASEAWFASGDSTCAQVTVVNCTTPSPIILEAFQVESARIMTMIYVPPSAISLSRSGTPPVLPSHMETVWMGTQCGKLIIYNASSESSRQCLSYTQFPDSITCLHYYKDQVFLATAEGKIVIFTRATGGRGCWDLTQHKTVLVHGGAAIRSMCAVGRHLWIGAGSSCYILHMETHRMEGTVELSANSGVSVSKLAAGGAGVWMSFSRTATLELYNAVTRICLQQIDIGATLNRLITKHKIDKLSSLDRLHVTALMASNGYLWIGTSIGAILVYRTPHLGGVPLITGKPYLAMSSHKGAVRVLIAVQTMATVSGSRLSQFISDEDSRNPAVIEGSFQDGESQPTPRTQSCASYIVPISSTFDPSASLRSSSPPPLPVPSFDDLSCEEGRRDTKKSGGGGTTQGTLEVVAEENVTTGNVLEDGEVDGSAEGISREDAGKLAEEKEGEVEGEEKEGEKEGEKEREKEGEEEEEEGENKGGEGTLRPVQANGDMPAASSELGESEQPQEGLKDTKSALSQSSDYELVDPQQVGRDEPPNETQMAQVTGSLVPGPHSDHGQLTSNVSVSSSVPEQPATQSGSDSRVPDPKSGEDTLKPQVNKARAFPDSDPCDTTILRVSSPDSGASGNEYDEVETCHSVKASDYENPVTLERGGPSPVGTFFTPVPTSAPTIPGRSMEPQEGAVFVLTAGRGIVDLRPVRKTAVLFPSPLSQSVVSIAGDESCMIAYEIEI